MESANVLHGMLMFALHGPGAYILSPLQDAGRDVSQNYGFMIGYRPLDQVITRVTSYSVNNMAPAPSLEESLSREIVDPLTSGTTKPHPYARADSSVTIQPVASPVSPSAPKRRPSAAHRRATSRESTGGVGKGHPDTTSNGTNTRRQQPKRSLSALLTSTLPKGAKGDQVVYVAFKALPVDHTIKDREENMTVNSSTFTQPGRSATVAPQRSSVDVSTGRKSAGDMTCREVVDAMCAQLVEACEEAGVGSGSATLLVEKDIVR